MIKTTSLCLLLMVSCTWVWGTTPPKTSKSSVIKHYNANLSAFNQHYVAYQQLLNRPTINIQMSKKEKFNKAGNVLLITGVASAVLGGVLIASADELYYTSNTTGSGTQTEGDPKGAIGVLFATTGVAGIVAGLIFKGKAVRMR